MEESATAKPRTLSVAAVYAGKASITEGILDATRGSTTTVHLSHHTETNNNMLSYLSKRWPQAIALGAEPANWQHTSPDIMEVSPECSPYTDAGKRRLDDDPKAIQVLWAVQALQAARPKIALWESVPNFWLLDDKHQLFSAAQHALRDQLVVSDIIYMKDTQLGGMLIRERGFAPLQDMQMYLTLPPWNLDPPMGSPGDPQQALANVDDLPEDCFRQGTLRMNTEPTPHDRSSPHIVAWMWWGDSTYATQPGVQVVLGGIMYKVEDMQAKHGLVRLLPQARDSIIPPKFVKRNMLNRSMHIGKWYAVYSMAHALKSPRTWGEEPEGRQCLLLETRVDPPRVRTTIGSELLRIMVHQYSQDSQNLIASAMFFLSDDAKARGAAGAISSAKSVWWGQQILARMQRWWAYEDSIVHTQVPQQHIDAPGLEQHCHRLVLVVATLSPVPMVWLPADGSMLCSTTQRHDRGHTTAEATTALWCSTLSLDFESIMAGELTRGLPPGAKVIVMAQPSPTARHIDSMATDKPRWVSPDSIEPDSWQRMAIDIAINRLHMTKGTHIAMTNELSSVFVTGALRATTLAVAQKNVTVQTLPFNACLKRTVLADSILRRSLGSIETYNRLVNEMATMETTLRLDMPSDVTLVIPEVRKVLSIWQDRFVPPPLQDIPESAKSAGCAQFQHDDFATLLFGEYCQPPFTEWLPRLPLQEATPGYHPTEWHHLHNSDTQVATTARLRVWETEEAAMLNDFDQLGGAAERSHKDILIIPESDRHPDARGKIYDRYRTKEGVIQLVDFHEDITTSINRPFANWVGGSYPDKEFMSHLNYGMTYKAEVHTHSVLCSHSESLRENYSSIKTQFLQFEELGMVELSSEIPTSPARCCRCGTVERKDAPGDPRMTDNHSCPMIATPDKDGFQIQAMNSATAEHKGYAPDPHEDKPSIPMMGSEIVILRHLADNTNEAVYAAKFDMKFWFNQMGIRMSEQWKNLRFLSSLHFLHPVGSWVKCLRMGYGAKAASNIGQRMAGFLVFVIEFFMDTLEAPHHERATGYKRQWLDMRKTLNTPGGRRQDRCYTTSMYTDDGWLVAVDGSTMSRLVFSMHLAVTNLGLALSGEHKMAIGTGIAIIGADIFLMLSIIALPAQKVLRGLEGLRRVKKGNMQLSEYEKLLGLLVHCLFLASMDQTLINDMWDPIGHAKHRGKPMGSLLEPERHDHLHWKWDKWEHTLNHNSAASLTCVLPTLTPDILGAASVHMWGDAFRDEHRSRAPTTVISEIKAGIGGFLEGYWYYKEVPHHLAKWLDTPELESLAIPANFIVFEDQLPSADSGLSLCVHADGLAAVQNLSKVRVKNRKMRYIMERTLALPQVKSRLHSIIISQDFGIGNTGGDAASRDHEERVNKLCLAFGIRPIRCKVPEAVTKLLEDAASYAQQVQEATTKMKRPRSKDEMHTGKKYRNTECKDGPPSMWRSPKKDCNQQPRISTDASPSTMRRSPKKENVAGPSQLVGIRRSPKKGTSPTPSTFTAMRRSPKKSSPTLAQETTRVLRSPKKVVPHSVERNTPNSPITATHMVRHPVKKPVFEMVTTLRSSLPAVKALHQVTAAKQQQVIRKAAAIMDMVLNAYPADSPYAVNPKNTTGLQHMIQEAETYLMDGVPDSTAAHEKSAWNKYWVPFCDYVGMSPNRPADSDLNPSQLKFEDTMKGIAAPWIYVRMRGKKNLRPDPNSVGSVLRHINRQINRDNDSDAKLKRPMKILKGILTEYVANYGPILPDQALPPPRQMLAAMLALPTGTKLGSRTLDYTTQRDLSFKTMIEVAAESGVRLDECTIGSKKAWNKSKMSRASLVWIIDGQLYPSATNPPATLEQLSNLTESDSAALSPATSKCDKWGNKHGHKTMYFPFRPNHTWNGARALRDYEMAFPCPRQERSDTPLFAAGPDEGVQSSHIRTMWYHMIRTPEVSATLPHGHLAKYSFHSLRKMYATGLSRAGASRARVQSMCRWLSEEAVDLYDKLDHKSHVTYVDAAYLNSPDVITPALLRKMADIKLDDNDVYEDMCKHVHIDLTGKTELDWS